MATRLVRYLRFRHPLAPRALLLLAAACWLGNSWRDELIQRGQQVQLGVSHDCGSEVQLGMSHDGVFLKPSLEKVTRDFGDIVPPTKVLTENEIREKLVEAKNRKVSSGEVNSKDVLQREKESKQKTTRVKPIFSGTAPEVRTQDLEKERATADSEAENLSDRAGVGELNTDNVVKEKEEEAEEIPWKMTLQDKLMLQGGWLVAAVVEVVVAILLIEYWPYAKGGDGDLFAVVSPEESKAAGPVQCLYDAFWGRETAGHLMNWFIVLLAMLNFLLFAGESEVNYGYSGYPEIEGQTELFGVPLADWVTDANTIVQNTTVFIIIGLVILRLVAVSSHPAWCRESTPALRFFMSDFYTHVDIICIIPTTIDAITGMDKYSNFTWFIFLRSIDMASREATTGAAIRQFWSLKEEAALLKLMLAMAVVIWLLLSGIYFVCNNENETSRWEAAEFQGQGWQRFESIPSSMFFVLVNLCCEYPLADIHVDPRTTTFSRIFAMITCFIGVPIFALPTGVVGTVLRKNSALEIQNYTEGLAAWQEMPGAEGPGGANGDGGGSAVGARTASEGEAAHVVGTEGVAALPRLEHHMNSRVLWWGTFFLSFGSVFVFFFYTASPTQFLFFEVNVTKVTNQIVDCAASVVFGGEWVYRLLQGGLAYQSTPAGIIDLLAWPFGLLHIFGADDLSMWIPAACVLRVLKVERYLDAFAVLNDIIVEHGTLLKATLFVSLHMLLACSTVLYFTERNNPDKEIRVEYGSVARAVWAELLNLHGEWIWCDYTALGKGICTIIAFFSTAVCMVPIIVFSDGWISRLKRSGQKPEPTWQERHQPTEDGLRRTLFELLHANWVPTPLQPRLSSRVFRATSLTLTMVSAVSTIFLSLSWFDPADPDFAQLGGHLLAEAKAAYVTDVVCTVFFATELILRLALFNLRYFFCLQGACDMLSIGAFIVTLTDVRDRALHPDYHASLIFDDMLIPLRLLRLFVFENYFPTAHVLKCVIRRNIKPLMESGYCLVCIWLIFGVVLYVFEHEPPPDTDDDGDEMPMHQRYKNVLVGLQYALVHVTGDYPISGYRWCSKFAHIFGCGAGMICVAAFTGVFSAGFVNYLAEERCVERRNAARVRWDLIAKCTCMVQSKFRQKLRRRQAIRDRAMALPDADGGSPQDGDPNSRRGPQRSAIQQCAANVIGHEMKHLTPFMLVAHTCLIVNVINTLISSIPEFDEIKVTVVATDIVEVLCTLVFLTEYVLKMLAAARPMRELFSLIRLLDLFCLLPTISWAVMQGKSRRWREHHTDLEELVEFSLMFRVTRVLDFPCLRREAKKTYRALGMAMESLAMPSILALNIWVFSTSIFVWVENYYEGPEQENMKTLPEGLYWTSIYIIGEWANVDFSQGAGSRICMFYCLFGIALFAIPVGLIVEAVQSTFMAISEERKEVDRLYSIGKSQSGLDCSLSGAGEDPRVFYGSSGGFAETPLGDGTPTGFA